MPLAAAQRAAAVLSFCDRELHRDKALLRILEGQPLLLLAVGVH